MDRPEAGEVGPDFQRLQWPAQIGVCTELSGISGGGANMPFGYESRPAGSTI